MKTRSYETEDFNMIAGWWNARGAVGFNADILPPIGFIVESDGKALAAGFLYLSMPICWLAHTVTNPANSARQSYEAIKMLNDVAVKEGAMLGMNVLLCAASGGLAELYKKDGFIIGDKNITQFFKKCEV